ncbi:hypothetical protein [Prevotella sp. KH2C16]|uniref:hypothetical protein n=1 Tax=Prevotella sp. KH2C16 TaxID=1855325 RepID=UPI0008E0A815|nr:hypothetical protein [Prevotella sp. KH2C16]SFG63558.1 hypothetical protein SAMN05216383_12428 [Prevotella sp. KH2C16]
MEKIQITREMLARAAFAAAVAEAVVGDAGMRVVKHELDRLPTEEVVMVWAGVHRLLASGLWPEAPSYARHVRRTAWFIAALVRLMPWPAHKELRKILEK